MRVEVVRLMRLEGSPLKAFCDIQFSDDKGDSDSFIVKKFKVVEGKEGLFVGMPCEIGKGGRWFNTFMPLSQSIKDKIEQVVLECYND